jgi:hypothetical protein
MEIKELLLYFWRNCAFPGKAQAQEVTTCHHQPEPARISAALGL